MPIPSRLPSRLIVVLLALGAASSCRRTPAAGSPAPPTAARERLRADLQLVPGDAHIVAWLDLERLRGSAMGKELTALPIREAALLLDGAARGLGIDPAEQVRQVLLAVPGERQEDGRFMAILRVDRLDRSRAAAWLGQRRSDGLAGMVRAPDEVVLARGAWTTALMAPGPTAAERTGGDDELLRLCERAGDHPVWLAAVIPLGLRRRLMVEPRFPDLGSLLRLRLSVDVDRELRAELVGELSNQPDAATLATRLKAYLDAAKRHPDMLAQGLAPYLDAVRLHTEGPNLSASLAVPAGQAGELGLRLRELLRPPLPAPASP